MVEQEDEPKKIESKEISKAQETARLIDNLPYIDLALDAEMKGKVQKLIMDEMETMEKKDYLKDFNHFEFDYNKTHYLAEELERIRKKRKMPAIDQTRYTISEPPTGQSNKPLSWRRSCENARIRLEENELARVDCALLKRHGAALWQLHAKQLETDAKARGFELSRLEAQIYDVNLRRKTEQENARVVMQGLSEQWWQLVRKNNEIETACKVLEMRIKARKK